jgi:GMP synthase (glutamine-hydrolysing)
MSKTAFAIRHVHFEDLGTFEPALTRAGYAVSYLDVGLHSLASLDPIRPDLLIALGGPVGVYDGASYPFLDEELRLLKTRLGANLPTFGICLGAQLMAAALGARVFPSGVKEIGFSPLSLTDAGLASPLRHLTGTPVLHWHGDTFDMPERASHLAATTLCRNQAFSQGANIMGVQFHPEADPDLGLERWLVGHAAELSAAGVSPTRLREDARGATSLSARGRAFFDEWLSGLQDGRGSQATP